VINAIKKLIVAINAIQKINHLTALNFSNAKYLCLET